MLVLAGDIRDRFQTGDLQPFGLAGQCKGDRDHIACIDAIFGQINGQGIDLIRQVVLRVARRTYKHGRYEDHMVSAAKKADIDGIGDLF